MLGPGLRVAGRRPEALPEDPDHDIGVGDLHPLVDQALWNLEVEPGSRVGLPTPYRQLASVRRRNPAIELIDDELYRVALARHVSWRDDHDTYEVNTAVHRLHG